MIISSQSSQWAFQSLAGSQPAQAQHSQQCSKLKPVRSARAAFSKPALLVCLVQQRLPFLT